MPEYPSSTVEYRGVPQRTPRALRMLTALWFTILPRAFASALTTRASRTRQLPHAAAPARGSFRAAMASPSIGKPSRHYAIARAWRAPPRLNWVPSADWSTHTGLLPSGTAVRCGYPPRTAGGRDAALHTARSAHTRAIFRGRLWGTHTGVLPSGRSAALHTARSAHTRAMCRGRLWGTHIGELPSGRSAAPHTARSGTPRALARSSVRSDSGGP